VDSQHLGSNFREPKILYHNNGNGTFTDISANAGPGITAVILRADWPSAICGMTAACPRSSAT